MRKVNEIEVMNLLERVVAEKGDSHIVEGTGCMYFHQDDETDEWAPSCIVGHVFSYLGVTGEQIDQRVDTPKFLGRWLNTEFWEDFPLDAIELEFTNTAWKMLDVAQDYQDDGKSWGDVLILAKKVFNGDADTL